MFVTVKDHLGSDVHIDPDQIVMMMGNNNGTAYIGLRDPNYVIHVTLESMTRIIHWLRSRGTRFIEPESPGKQGLTTDIKDSNDETMEADATELMRFPALLPRKEVSAEKRKESIRLLEQLAGTKLKKVAPSPTVTFKEFL